MARSGHIWFFFASTLAVQNKLVYGWLVGMLYIHSKEIGYSHVTYQSHSMSVDEFIQKTSMLKKQSDFSRFCLRVSLVPRPSPSFLSLAVWFCCCKRREAGRGSGFC